MSMSTQDMIGSGALAVALACVVGYNWYSGRMATAAAASSASAQSAQTASDFAVNSVYSNTMTYANNPSSANYAVVSSMPDLDQYVPTYIYSNAVSRTPNIPQPSLTTQAAPVNTSPGGCSTCSGWGWSPEF